MRESTIRIVLRAVLVGVMVAILVPLTLAGLAVLRGNLVSMLGGVTQEEFDRLAQQVATPVLVAQGGAMGFYHTDDPAAETPPNAPCERIYRNLAAGIQIRCPVTFQQPFSSIPSVTLALSSLDVNNDANTRVGLEALNISREGFQVLFGTWGNNGIDSAGVSWLAVAETLPRSGSND